MSLSQFHHPTDVIRHPQFEPEVKRAILASWASDAYAIEGKPALRWPPDATRAIHIDDVMNALRELDKRAH